MGYTSLKISARIIMDFNDDHEWKIDLNLDSCNQYKCKNCGSKLRAYGEILVFYRPGVMNTYYFAGFSVLKCAEMVMEEVLG